MNRTPLDSSRLKDLAPAGGGLSPLRAFAARRILFPLADSFFTFDRALKHFLKEGRRAVELAATLERDELFERVMVPPLFGLEENSRYYSTAMALEHLLIVGLSLRDRIPPLSRGEHLDREVRIEDYKPYVEIPDEIVQIYGEFLEGFEEHLRKDLGDIHRENRHIHPWFGALNPKQWMVMGAIHQSVHRRQIEAIVASLPTER